MQRKKQRLKPIRNEEYGRQIQYNIKIIKISEVKNHKSNARIILKYSGISL